MPVFSVIVRTAWAKCASEEKLAHSLLQQHMVYKSMQRFKMWHYKSDTFLPTLLFIASLSLPTLSGIGFIRFVVILHYVTMVSIC